MSSKDVSDKRPILVGPWGGQGGSPWDDGVYTAVRQLVVVHGAAIDSIRFEYDRKGSSVWSERHGNDGGAKRDQVRLDYPDEILTSVSGHYGPLSNGGPFIIRSLTFESNHSKYGPFGFEQGMHFSFPINGGKIVGFHGRSGNYLDSIGVYLKQLWLPKLSQALVPSQSFTTNSNWSNEYGGMDGKVSKGYDIIVALRERGENFTIVSNMKEAQPSQSHRDLDLKNKVITYSSYAIEKGSSALRGAITYGPWGGSGGTIFDDGIFSGIRQINLTRNVGITSIKLLYDRNGQAVWGNKHGGNSGMIKDKITLDFPFEILTHITGYFGTTMLMGPTVIKSLTFHTTKKVYGPYGDEQGVFFTSGLAAGMVVGFHGRSGWYIDSIGVHVLEGKVPLPHSISHSERRSNATTSTLDNPQWSSRAINARKDVEEEVKYGIIKEPAPTGPGPWGGDGGKTWDDGVYSGVKQIYITRGEFINSIQIEYDRSGQSVWSTRHGGSGEITHRIKMEYPNEVLNSISGYYGTLKGDNGVAVVKSLSFYTTRGKYGPYGDEVGTYFTSSTSEGKIVGFHGRSGQYLDAIGVHMQHWLGEKKSSTKKLFSKYFI